MTDMQKEQIRYLRCEGLGYKAIASRLGMSENTVKSFCKRNGMGGVADQRAKDACRQCGGDLRRGGKGKPQKFCSEACRRAWWAAHPFLSERHAFYSLTCAHCGKSFESYGNQGRKYCGRVCYIQARFGKGTEA